MALVTTRTLGKHHDEIAQTLASCPTVNNQSIAAIGPASFETRESGLPVFRITIIKEASMLSAFSHTNGVKNYPLGRLPRSIVY